VIDPENIDFDVLCKNFIRILIKPWYSKLYHDLLDVLVYVGIPFRRFNDFLVKKTSSSPESSHRIHLSERGNFLLQWSDMDDEY
jgi:hypothetical protein